MWFKVDDKFHDHPKVQTLLERGQGDALMLWLLAGSWCGDQRSDGRVSGFTLGRWDPGWRDHAAALVDARLWTVEEEDGREFYRFHDWTEFNPSKADQDADAAVQRRKVALHRDPKLVAQIRARDEDRCRYCGSGVDFNDRRSAMGGTYDHVDPDGPNNLGNVVVACRGCNSAKGHRTPEEWGYGLLKAGSMQAVRKLRTVAGGPDLDTNQNVEGSRAGRAGSGPGSGRVGSGADMYPDTGVDRSEAGDDEQQTNPGTGAA